MDYSKSVMSLLHKLQQEEVNITKVFDGMNWEKISGNSKLEIRKNATDAITSVDEAIVCVEHNGTLARLFIVLGNEECEILADWGGKPNTTIFNIIEKVEEEFIAQWE
jgi:hypothetical protein